jgi:predicted HicB family RNase H-like nuclease
MSSTKKDDVKEITNQFKESTDRYLEQQKQQFKDTASNVSDTTEKLIKM